MKIFLIGFMGAGKTYLGKKLAEIMHLKFTDLDHLIEESNEKTIRELFFTKGEKYFRHLETTCLQSIIREGIIACGGGICDLDENRRIIREKADLIIWLASSWNILRSRIKDSERPLLTIKDEKELKELYSFRINQYQKLADLIYKGNSPRELKLLIEKTR